MPLQTFTWCADKEATGTHQFKVRTAQFGDGYAQTAADGINNKSQQWPLTFTKRMAEAEAIKQFFDSHSGSVSFLWKPPLETERLFKVSSYSVNPLGAGWYRISATFEQSFNP